MKYLFDKVAILGIGLIGGSLGLALRHLGICRQVIGWGRNPLTLSNALKAGIINKAELDINLACIDANLVVLATPVSMFLPLTSQISSSLKKNAILTDVGSVKGSLVYEIEKIIPTHVEYIASHPIAGGERSGMQHSRGDLFQNAQCIITPTQQSSEESLNTISQMWRLCGCKVHYLDPYKHDEIFAQVSHLPHIAAFALVNTIQKDFISYAGQGFKDTTRIAMSSAEMWRDIAIANKKYLIEAIDIYINHLNELRQLMEIEDGDRLSILFEQAKSSRMSL